MKSYTKEELKKILEDHRHWYFEDCEGWEDMRADLTGADLKGADLKGADLTGADLTGAYLTGADLKGADLTGAYLTGADLKGADLAGAYLKGADLKGADLTGADLTGAYLTGADLTGAYLKGADLTGAYLTGADITGADLTGADLTVAYLTGADLKGAKNVPFIPYACPDFGMFIGYKKAHGKIVELEIPSDAKRMSSTGRKCRCDKAKVLGIYDSEHNLLPDKEVASDRIDSNGEYLKYKVGEMVYPDSFDDDRWNECTHGIHFFINFMEAVQY